jgi:ABC-type transport system involved in cytochrome c biogenesis ATPase subunit
MFFQDLEYTHLLYNTFGPYTLHINEGLFIKLQTNNGTGKTMLLKTILGLLITKRGLLVFTNMYSKSNKVQQTSRLSNSQTKKYKLIESISNMKKKNWILDEPYSFLDFSSIIFYKKKINTHINKCGSVILTDCIKKTMLPSIIYYASLLWL